MTALSERAIPLELTRWLRRQPGAAAALKLGPVTRAEVVAEVRAGWKQGGWRVFASDEGRFWATTTARPVVIPESYWQPRHTVMGKDGVDGDTYTELAAKLERRAG